jgi:hypothetical protein
MEWWGILPRLPSGVTLQERAALAIPRWWLRRVPRQKATMLEILEKQRAFQSLP